MPHSRRHTDHSCRAFTIVPLALILWIVLLIIGFMLWQKTPPVGYVPAKGVGPGQIGSMILAVVYGGFWFFMLGPFAEKKGQVWGNIAAAIVFGLAALMMGLSYAGLTADQRTLARNSGPAVSPGRPAPSGTLAVNPTPEKPPYPRVQPSAASTTPAPADAPSQATPTPAPMPPPSPVPRAPRTPPAPTTPPVSQAAIDAFAADLTAEISTVIAKAEALLPDLARMPAHDLTRIKKRTEDAAGLRALADALAKRLDSADTDLAAKLQQAGASEFDAIFAARSWSASGFSVATRSFGARSIVRLCDKVKEECDSMQETFGKWTLDSKGEIKCSDFQIKSKLKSLHFFVKAEADRKQFIVDQLQGK